jgi:chemotaxis response regulator CheB
MPKAAVQLGAVDRTVALSKMAQAIVSALERRTETQPS